MKHFSRVWITGSTNHKPSSVVDHATSEQHRAVMTRVRAAAARIVSVSLTNYAPIAYSLMVMDDAGTGTHEKEVRYFLCHGQREHGIS